MKPTIDSLSGTLGISCKQPASGSTTTTCGFQQSILNQLFGSDGLSLSDCTFGECVAQSVIDSSSPDSQTKEDTHKSLSGGVIAGLAVVGALLLLAIGFLLFGCVKQRRARKGFSGGLGNGGVTIAWQNVSYVVQNSKIFGVPRRKANRVDGFTDEKVILDNVSGRVEPGQMMAILGPSGAGKTTLVEILAGKQKMGVVSGTVTRSSTAGRTNISPRIAFVPQQDVLPAMLTVREALLFAAELRLPESVPFHEKHHRVEEVIRQLGLERVADTRIGSGERRGISGGEMRRVSIGLELVSLPDALVLDEPTSGLDSVSAARVADVLRAVAHDPQRPTAVIASIHQPSSKLYHTFDRVMVLAHGRALYAGPGGLEPLRALERMGVGSPPEGYNVAEHLLDVASDPSPAMFSSAVRHETSQGREGESEAKSDSEKSDRDTSPVELEKGGATSKRRWIAGGAPGLVTRSQYAATFLTQLEVLSGREWKILRRCALLLQAFKFLYSDPVSESK